MAKKPFIPRDKPKSWVVGVCSVMVGLLFAGPLMFLGQFLAWSWLFKPAAALFALCVLTGFAMWFVGLAGTLTGRHKGIVERDWHEQVW